MLSAFRGQDYSTSTTTANLKRLRWINQTTIDILIRWIPGGAKASRQALQLGKSAVPDLQLFDSSVQIVCELRQLLHRPHVLHEDLFLQEVEDVVKGLTACYMAFGRKSGS